MEGSIAELVEEWKQWEERILAFGIKEAATSKSLAAKMASMEGECTRNPIISNIPYSRKNWRLK